MAIEKVTTYDYEVVHENTVHHAIQIRRCDSYVDSAEPNVVMSSSFHRYSFDPEGDWSSEPDKVKAICDAVFTDEVIAAYVTNVEAITSPSLKAHFAAKRYKD